jgi:phosphoenolpyruvate-protein kinase (PTS system EI component)
MTFRGTGVSGFAKGKAFVIDRPSPFGEIPEGSIVVTDKIALEESAAIDLTRVIGLVVEEDPEGAAVLLGRGTGIPAIVVGTGSGRGIVTGDLMLIQKFDVIVTPDLAAMNRFEALRSAADSQLSLDL